MRPETCIFDDGAHFEVREVHEVTTTPKMHPGSLNEQQQKSIQRKVSQMPEESEVFRAEKTSTSAPTKSKAPYLNIHVRHETTSTESKDTLTPIEPNEQQTFNEEEDASTENIMELNFETARQKALRRRAMGRRNSESYSNYDLNRSQTSLNAILAMSRRQLSLTQSEPDSGNELLGLLLYVLPRDCSTNFHRFVESLEIHRVFGTQASCVLALNFPRFDNLIEFDDARQITLNTTDFVIYVP